MNSAKKTGRIIGFLSLVQLTGLIVPFVLLLPITVPAPENLLNAGAFSSQVKVAVFLLFANCCLTIGISIVASQVFRHHSNAFALLLVALSVIMFAAQAVDNIQIMAMISLSGNLSGTESHDEHLRIAAAILGSVRRWAHFAAIVAIDGWMFVFYACLYRFRSVPRTLSAFGLLTVLLHFSGIVVPILLGIPSVAVMGAAMGLGHLATGLWLVVKGFAEFTPISSNTPDPLAMACPNQIF